MGSASLAGMFRGWNNGERAYAVGLTFAVVLLSLCAMIYDGPQGEYKPYPNAAANGNAEQYSDLGISLQVGDLIVQSIMALGTLALFALGWRSFVAANEATERSLQLTRDSIDAMKVANATAKSAADVAVALGRGTMVFVSTKLATGGKHVIYEFKNVGGSVVMLKTIGTDMRPLNGFDLVDNPVRRDITPVSHWNTSVDPKAIFTHEVGGGEKIPPHCFRPDGTMHHLLVQYEVRYTTLHHDVVYHCAWAYIVGEGGLKHFMPEYEYYEYSDKA